MCPAPLRGWSVGTYGGQKVRASGSVTYGGNAFTKFTEMTYTAYVGSKAKLSVTDRWTGPAAGPKDPMSPVSPQAVVGALVALALAASRTCESTTGSPICVGPGG